MKQKKYLIIRPHDEVVVLLMPHKDTGEYSFVNLTKGHICPCRFKSIRAAIRDMEEYKRKGKILEYRLLYSFD